MNGWVDFPNSEQTNQDNLFIEHRNDSLIIIKYGPRDGLASCPNIKLGVGFRVLTRNVFLVQANLWTVGLAFQHERDKLDFGIGIGKYYLSISEKLRIGPWLREGSTNYNWLLNSRQMNLNAYIGIKFFSFRSAGDKKDATTKEF
jgi:hypothetical protein